MGTYRKAQETVFNIRLSLFGPPGAEVNGMPVDIPRDKALALLIYLALTGTAHRRDRLAAMFWPDSNQAQARAYLRNALYVLNKACGETCVQSDRRSVDLQPDASIQTDVGDFLAELANGRTASTEAEAIAHFARAADLARSPFLAGFSLPDAPEFEEWQLLQQRYLQRELDSILQTLISSHRALEEYAPAIGYAQRWVALDPLHEPAQCALMQVYALSGKKTAALRQYEEIVHLLRDELDAEPSADTRTIYQEIKRAREAETLPAAVWSLAESPGDRGIPNNLPNELTPLVGRETELIELDQLLAVEDVPLITIVGPGGIGKTRLVLASAARQVKDNRFHDGVFFVALAPLSDTDQIAPAIARAAGWTLNPGRGSHRTPAQQVVNHLRHKQMLLVLDNFEHLLSGAELILDILQAAPQVRMLVTSRERLQMRAEQVYAIRGLEYGDPAAPDAAADTAAVHLFVQCARRVAPGYVIAGEDLGQVARICHLVEGMPLAIELAAGWIELLSPAEITREIRSSLNFLQAARRDMPQRHHSLRAVLDASWQRLDAPDQSVFAALSVFRGGFTREAGREVAGATLRQLSTLAGKSMIQPDRSDASGRVRYTIHELLRQYGAIRLAESPAVVRHAGARHCAYYTDFLDARLDAINGPDQRRAIEEVADELDNMRAAWQWAVEHSDVGVIHRAATTLFLFCQQRSLFLEGAEALAAAAASLYKCEPSTLRDLTLAQVLNHEGWLRIRIGEFDTARLVLEASRALYAQPHVPPPPSYMGTDPATPLAIVAEIRGNSIKAVELGQEALHGAMARGDRYNQCYAHYVLTSAKSALGDYAAAARHAQQACALAQAVGNRWFSAILLAEWGKVAQLMADYVQARNHFLNSLAIMREFEDPEGTAVALNHLGDIAVLQRDLGEAGQLYGEALSIYRELSDRVGLATSLRGLAQVAGAQGDVDEALDQFGRALAIAAETQFLPLLFAVLIDMGDLLLTHGRTISGIAALLQVQRHPAADYAMKARADTALSQWRAHLDPNLYRETTQQVEAMDLSAVVSAIQAEAADISRRTCTLTSNNRNIYR